VRADERINAYFLNAAVDGGQFIDCLIDQIAVVAGCPGATYTCADMQAAHAGRKISQVDFADFVADLAEALAEHRAELAPMLTDGDVAALASAFEAMQPDIVEDPDDDLTLYQRLGRKPGLWAVVGQPGVAGTWLGRVEADDTLSGFFVEAEWQRLQTCLVRQLGGIDGPAIYGQEVDAPPGIDVGVSAKAPCVAMQPAHAGVVDQSMGGAPVTADDFMTMSGHLALALADAGASDADRQALLAAIEPLCPDIVVDDEKCPGQSQSETFEVMNLAKIAEDGFYDGTPATMACHEFEAAADAIDVVTAVEVEVGIDSGHAGDLTIKLLAPGGEIVTLVSRPGFAEAADDGGQCSGDSSNLKSTSPLLFRAGGAKDAETMGDSIAGDQTICLDDAACDYAPNAGAATPGDLAGLAGTQAAGSWKICVGDSCGGFTTTLQVARLTVAQKK
jgi:subtilisin-like proprotein convertase family protein/truncated hemoglobin YjbI